MKLYEQFKFIFMFLLLQFLRWNSWKALKINAYFNFAMLWMYQIDSYALDLLAYFNSAMLWMYQIDSFALDLLAYFNSDGHKMSVGIASQWFIMQSTQSAIYSCQGGLGRHVLIVYF
jgi:hypothetical protein